MENVLRLMGIMEKLPAFSMRTKLLVRVTLYKYPLFNYHCYGIWTSLINLLYETLNLIEAICVIGLVVKQ